MSDLPLTLRKNLKDHEPKRDAHLKNIEATTGIAFTIEVANIKEVNDSPVLEKGRQNSLGDLLYNALPNAVNELFKNTIKGDSMVKEGLQEKMTAKKLIFKGVFEDIAPVKGSATKFHKNDGATGIAIEDGALVFSFNVKAPGANMADATQFKLIDML